MSPSKVAVVLLFKDREIEGLSTARHSERYRPVVVQYGPRNVDVRARIQCTFMAIERLKSWCRLFITLFSKEKKVTGFSDQSLLF